MSRKFSLYEYSRYAKTRHRGKSDGQTGYTMNILDAKVETIIRHIFDTMKEIPAGEAVNHSCEVKISELKARLKTANLEYEKAARSVEALDEELIKALQGESCFTQERLSRILDEKDAALREAKLHRDSIAAELADHEQQRRDSQKDYDQLLTWSSMYDQADRS